MVLRTTSRLAAGTALLALAVAACGGDDGDGGGSAGGEGTGGTVEIATAGDFGEILVDSQGMALYTSDVEEEASGDVVCTGECADIWVPSTLPEGQTEAPAAPAGLTGELGVVERPDSGAMQLTLDGIPLYTFDFDQEPGDVTGHEAGDTFDGIAYLWFVATASGEAPSVAPPVDTGSGYY